MKRVYCELHRHDDGCQVEIWDTASDRTGSPIAVTDTYATMTQAMHEARCMAAEFGWTFNGVVVVS